MSGMDTELFDEVLRLALDNPEIVQALDGVARGREDRLTALRQEFTGRLRDAWDDMRSFVSEELARYESELAAFRAARADFPPPEIRTAVEQAKSADHAAEAAKSHLASLSSRRIELEIQIFNAHSTKPGRNAIARLVARGLRASDTRLARELQVLQEQITEAERNQEALAQKSTEASIQVRMLEFADEWRRAPDGSATEPEPVALTRERMEAARVDLQLALLQKAALPLCREWLNETVAKDREQIYRLVFDTPDTSGLRQMTAAKHEIPTDAFKRLSETTDQLGGGAIGVSGPRGAGKSTLIRSACNGGAWLSKDRRFQGVFVPAPVEYVPREFLLHLFAKLCLTVAPEAGHDESPASKPMMSGTFLLGATVSVMIAGAALLATALMTATGINATAGLLSALAFVVAMGIPLSRAGWFDDGFDFHGLQSTFTAFTLSGAALSGVAAWRNPSSSTTEFVLHIVGIGNLLSLAVVMIYLWSYRIRRVQYLGAATSVGLMLATLLVGNVVSPTQRLAVLFFVLAACLAWLPAVPSRIWPSKSRTGQVIAASITMVGYSSLTMGVILSVATAWHVEVDPRLAWGSLLIMAGGTIVTLWRRTDEEAFPQEGDYYDPRISRSRDELRKIRFQQTFTSGQTETLRIGAIAHSPIEATLATATGTSMARVPLTYPEIVASFHDYIREVIRGFDVDDTAEQQPLIIGIDELDKLSAEGAHRFMNEIKAIFDEAVPGCYYLVSVSEEALAGFEQRGLPTRDVFDTAFDEMLHIDYLTVAGTIEMLGRRIIDLPRGVAQLCHALAGGLPRDVIRSVRAVVAARDRTGTNQVARLAEVVCTQELASRVHGLRTALRKLPDWHDAADLSDWAGRLRLADITSSGDLPPRLLRETPGSGQALGLLQVHACSYYHLATITQFFSRADMDALELAERDTGAAGIENLARARNEIGTTWAVAWRRVSRFRDAWNLPSLPNP
jgi:hypothetical protein